MGSSCTCPGTLFQEICVLDERIKRIIACREGLRQRPEFSEDPFFIIKMTRRRLLLFFLPSLSFDVGMTGIYIDLIILGNKV